ncbi:MAG TPA: hypothetical protein PLW44_09600 [Chitinophagales bacterium]|nr:hypothetical protein [Chitinophagales bacterium]
MKTLELIQCLVPDEIEKLENELTQQGKHNTVTTLRHCLQHSGIDKGELFPKLFEKEYTTDKDYLLRNQIRLLNKAIENFIVKQEVPQPGNEQVAQQVLLGFYLKKGNAKLFDDEWQPCYKRAQSASDGLFLFHLMKLRTQYVSELLPVSEQHYTVLYNILINAVAAIDKLALELQYEYRVYVAFVRRTLHALNVKEIAPVPVVCYTGDVFKLDTPTVINYCKWQIYEPDLTFEKKLPFYRQLINLYAGDAKNLAIAYGNLGVEYFVRSDFEQAYKNYYEAYCIVQDNNMPYEAKLKGVLFNLVSSAVSIGQYNKAIAIYNKHKQLFDAQTQMKHNLQRIVAIAYLSVGDYKAAFDCMPNDINERGKNEYYYYRAVYAMGFLLSKDYSMAVRETENAYRALRANPFEGGDYEKLFLAIKHLIKYKLDKKGSKAIITRYLDAEKNIGFHLKELIINSM